jgi:hypothetical protein
LEGDWERLCCYVVHVPSQTAQVGYSLLAHSLPPGMRARDHEPMSQGETDLPVGEKEERDGRRGSARRGEQRWMDGRRGFLP